MLTTSWLNSHERKTPNEWNADEFQVKCWRRKTTTHDSIRSDKKALDMLKIFSFFAAHTHDCEHSQYDKQESILPFYLNVISTEHFCSAPQIEMFFQPLIGWCALEHAWQNLKRYQLKLKSDLHEKKWLHAQNAITS